MKKFLLITTLLFCTVFLFAQKDIKPLGITKSDVENFFKNSDDIIDSFKEYNLKEDAKEIKSILKKNGISGDNSIEKVITIMSYLKQTQGPDNPNDKKGSEKGKPEGKKDFPEAKDNPGGKRPNPNQEKLNPNDKKGSEKGKPEGKKDFPEAKDNPGGKRPNPNQEKLNPNDKKGSEKGKPEGKKDFPEAKDNPDGKRPNHGKFKPIHPDDLKVIEENIPKT